MRRRTHQQSSSVLLAQDRLSCVLTLDRASLLPEEEQARTLRL